MVVIHRYNQDQWNAMHMLKTSLRYMKGNNTEGQFDNAISKQRAAWKHFLTGAPFRKELPDQEEGGAVAA